MSLVEKGKKGAEKQAEVRKGVRFADMDWFLDNLEALTAQYPGEWLAITEDQVRAHALDVNDLYAQIRREGIKRPFVAQLPTDAELGSV